MKMSSDREELPMATELYICLDLGNDTLKASFAYEHEGQEAYGKLTVPHLVNQVAFPAAAFYDTDTKTWRFADELETGDNKNFSTVVKIKSMLSLVVRHEDEAVEARNLEYYRTGHYFPIFSFPVRRRNTHDYQYLVDQKLVFEDPRHTPQSMCEDFFLHIKSKLQQLIDGLSEDTGITFAPLKKIAVVHPPKQGTECTDELSRLIRKAFGYTPIKILTSTQALGLFALHKGLLSRDEQALFFDMGDETVSVTKAWYNEIGGNKKSADQKPKMGILMDSPNGHMPPLELGGSHIDEAVMAHLEACIHDRETVGSPSADQPDHIYENGLYTSQYLLMKDIKKAKMVMPMAGKGMFKDGVPISAHRETLVQRLIGETDFLQCVGFLHYTGVAKALLDYIIQELARPGNRDVKKIFLAGGMAETHGLLSFLRQSLASDYGHIRLLTFGGDVDDNHPYHIQYYETSTYAASVGGAIVAMKDYSVDAVLSYSYGTWLYHGSHKKHLKLFADRGDLLENDLNRFAIEGAINLEHNELSILEGDELFSTIINSAEIEQRRYADQVTYEDEWLIVGDVGDNDRYRAERAIDLRVVAGGRGTEIQFFYRDQRVSLFSDTACVIYFEEGFMVDKNGFATPFFSNSMTKNHTPIYVKYLSTNRVENANACDIEFRMTMTTIEVATNT